MRIMLQPFSMFRPFRVEKKNCGLRKEIVVEISLILNKMDWYSFVEEAGQASFELWMIKLGSSWKHSYTHKMHILHVW